MYSLIQLKTLVSCGRDPARPLPLGRGFLLIPLMMVCFAFLPQMRAGLPPEIPGNPDGCYPAFNTAEGCNALFSVTGGIGDTGLGWYWLFIVGNGSFNTRVGAGALALTSGAGSDSNTAVGAAAIRYNQINAMLLNEFLKEHQTVQQLKATTEKQQATIALQEGQIKALTASLREQAAQIQKVSAQIEMIKPAPQVVENR